jgi:hypothetical protein
VIDWRNKDAADYYVNEVIGLHTATDKNIDGAETALARCRCMATLPLISSEITIICQHSLWTNRTGGAVFSRRRFRRLGLLDFRLDQPHLCLAQG